jgi:MFS family permease
VAPYTDIKGKAFLFLLFLWFVWFMNYGCRTIFSPIMPLIEDEFAISHAKASSLFAFTSAGYGISLFVSGMLVSRFGYKRSILVSLFVCGVTLFLVPQMKSFSHLTILGFILGLAAGMHLPSIIPIITDYYEEKIWGKVLSLHDTGISFGVFVAPFVALFFITFFSWRVMFYVIAALFGVCLIVFFFVCKELDVHKTQKGFIGSVLKSRSLWLLGIMWIFAVGANLAVYFIIPLYLTKELSFDIGYANTIFGFSRLGGAAVTIAGGFLIDRFSLRKTMFTVVFATGIFTLFLSHWNPRIIVIFLFIQSSLIPVFFPVGLVAISRMFEKEKRSLAAGFLGALSGLFGVGLLPYLLGLAGDHISFRFGIFVLGIMVILSSGLTYFLKELD